MRKILWLIPICLFIACSTGTKDYVIDKNVGDLTVKIRIDRNPPIVGDNNLEVGLTDTTGKQVTDAVVTLDYGMSAMPGMPAISYKANAQMRDGKYHALMKLSMAGPWTITIKINRPGKIVSAKFTVDAR